MEQKKIGKCEKISLDLKRRKISPLEMAKFEQKKKKIKCNLLEEANFVLKK